MTPFQFIKQTAFKFNQIKYISYFGIGVSFCLLYSCHAKIKICNKMIWDIYHQKNSKSNDNNDDSTTNNDVICGNKYDFCIK